MKHLLIGIATILLYTFIIVFKQDISMATLKENELKYVAEELSASASLFDNKVEYSKGRKVFDQVEGNKAVSHQIRTLLKLDSAFQPLSNSYWTDTIQYWVYYFDDSNTTYPYLYRDNDTLYTFVVTQPTVIVKINAGRARFRIPAYRDTSLIIRSSSHEWKKR